MTNNQMAQVIAVAKSQVGVREGYVEGGWNNIARYANEVPGLTWAQGQSWCATFTSWVAMRAGVASLFARTADCSAAVTFYNNAGRWSWYPALGAQVMYGTSGQDHTGIVIAYDATYIWTVEANTNDNGSTEGDGVYIRKRKRADAVVYGYGLPAYAEGIYTADIAKKGVSGYIYQAAHAGPGPAELTSGAVAVQNLVADTATVTGPLNVGRTFIQQNDGSTVALEVIGFTTVGGTPQLVLVKDADGIARFEVNAQGQVIHRGQSLHTSSIQIGSTTPDTGGGGGVLSIKDASPLPTSNASGGAILYSQNGIAKVRNADGSVGILNNGSPFSPAGNGYVAWNYDPASAVGQSGTTSGVLHMTRVDVPVSATATNLVVSIQTAGASLTAGQNLAGLYDANGVLLGSTADQASNWVSSGHKSMALTAGVALSPGTYYVGLLSVGTTPPQFLRTVGSSASASTVNVNLSNATLRWGTTGTGLTALPSTVTMSGRAASGSCLWAGLS
jgi:hypothetical protein